MGEARGRRREGILGAQLLTTNEYWQDQRVEALGTIEVRSEAAWFIASVASFD